MYVQMFVWISTRADVKKIDIINEISTSVTIYPNQIRESTFHFENMLSFLP